MGEIWEKLVIWLMISMKELIADWYVCGVVFIFIIKFNISHSIFTHKISEKST